MLLLAGGLAVVAIATALNLLLSVGLIHRLREVHRAMMEWSERVSINSLRSGLRQGEPLPEFSATTSSGSPLTREIMMGDSWLLGFFAGSCGSCRVELPRLTDIVREADSRFKSLVVIDGSAHQSADLLEMATPVGATVLEEDNGTLSNLFGVRFFPTFFLTDREGRIAFGSNSVDDVSRFITS